VQTDEPMERLIACGFVVPKFIPIAEMVAPDVSGAFGACNLVRTGASYVKPSYAPPALLATVTATVVLPRPGATTHNARLFDIHDMVWHMVAVIWPLPGSTTPKFMPDSVNGVPPLVGALKAGRQTTGPSYVKADRYVEKTPRISTVIESALPSPAAAWHIKFVLDVQLTVVQTVVPTRIVCEKSKIPKFVPMTVIEPCPLAAELELPEVIAAASNVNVAPGPVPTWVETTTCKLASPAPTACEHVSDVPET